MIIVESCLTKLNYNLTKLYITSKSIINLTLV